MRRIMRLPTGLDHARGLTTSLWGIAVYPGIMGWNIIPLPGTGG
jgi:hypothetical protein